MLEERVGLLPHPISFPSENLSPSVIWRQGVCSRHVHFPAVRDGIPSVSPRSGLVWWVVTSTPSAKPSSSVSASWGFPRLLNSPILLRPSASGSAVASLARRLARSWSPRYHPFHRYRNRLWEKWRAQRPPGSLAGKPAFRADHPDPIHIGHRRRGFEHEGCRERAWVRKRPAANPVAVGHGSGNRNCAARSSSLYPH